jgi:hypothetical protein
MTDLPRSNVRVHVVWCFAFITACVTGFLAYKMTLDKAEEAMKGARNAVAAATAKAEDYARNLASFVEVAAEKFRTGQITETFRAEIPVFKAAGIGRLDVGTADAIETFYRSDTREIVWDLVYLGTTVSTIRVPVTYRYHVDLGGNWKLSVKDRICVVNAPALQPSLPVAIHTDGMTKESSSGWSRFDATQQLDDLEKTITPKLDEYASTPEHISLVRDQARLTVAKFIRAWLLREDQWRDDKITSVVVFFENEELNNGSILKPTLTYEHEPEQGGAGSVLGNTIRIGP